MTRTRDTQSHVVGFLLAVVFATVACGRGSTPTAPNTPLTSSPSPTPPPPVVLRLSAPADYYWFSPPLAQLLPNESFEMTIRPVELNHADAEEYGHAVEFWLFQSNSTDSAEYGSDGFAMGLTWCQDATWAVSQRQPGIGYSWTGERIQMQLGEEYTVRVSRYGDSRAEFFLDGRSLVVSSDSSSAEYVMARVVGATADVSYVRRASSTSAGFVGLQGKRGSCSHGSCRPTTGDR